MQIELKTLQISPRRAMQQIVDYKNDPGNGYSNSLLCFIQLFIVSNRSNTYYFANNRNQHLSFNAEDQFLPVYKWAKEDNSKVDNLYDFADKFLTKCTLGEMISRYMVLVESDQKLLVMRPYQIYAVKAIVNCIHQNRGNGYIWHYKHRSTIERYSRKIPMAEIEQNDFNLNISRYVSTSVDEEKIDLLEVNKKLVAIEQDIKKAQATHNQFLKELGLPPVSRVSSFKNNI